MDHQRSNHQQRQTRPHPPPTWQGMAVFCAALALAMMGLGVQAFSSAAPATASATCQADPSATIAALPAGGTFAGSGCYLVPNGLLLTKPVTIDGGTYVDPSTTIPTRGAFQPVILVNSTSDVTLEHLGVVGGNPSGAFVRKLVGQAGIELKNTARVTIRDATVQGTFGDGLELWANAPGNMSPNTDLVVDGLTVTAAGRNGISPSDVSGATLSNVNVVSWGLTSIDFESDISGVGAGNVTISDSAWGGTFIQEAITGPLSFVRCTLTTKVQVTSRTPVGYPITFSGGSLAIGPKAKNIGIVVRGPTAVTFDQETFTRQPRPSGHPQVTPMWSVTGGASLMVTGSSLAPPLGTNDASSMVAITP